MKLSCIKRLTKKQLRSKILSKLRKQKKEERLKKSRNIKEQLFKTVAFRKAKRIMFYLALNAEVQTKEMISAAQKQGKIVAVPVCQGKKKQMIPSKIGLKERLKKGLYGLPEPRKKRPLAIEDIDLVVIPGVAFDKKGNRLGRGKGYYDAFLQRLPAQTVTIGLAFDCQILPTLPLASHDIAVDQVLYA